MLQRIIVKIPKERINILRKFKKDIEKEGNVKIKINNEVLVMGEGFNTYVTSNVIKAIGRGFSYENARKLFKDYTLYVIPISKNRNTLQRIKARLIGTKGKVRKRIEEMTNTKICIYGKTVSIIGKGDNLSLARSVIEKIIEGYSHAYVFRFLQVCIKKGGFYK
ncbi:MAG: KH domain-containing protein [Candidatus Aenigmatarchaeota archaeon]